MKLVIAMSEDRCIYCGEKLIRGYDFINDSDYFIKHSHYKKDDADKRNIKTLEEEYEELRKDQEKAGEQFPSRCPECDCHIEEEDRIDEDTIECFVCGYHVNRIKDEYGDSDETD